MQNLQSHAYSPSARKSTGRSLPVPAEAARIRGSLLEKTFVPCEEIAALQTSDKTVERELD